MKNRAKHCPTHLRAFEPKRTIPNLHVFSRLQRVSPVIEIGILTDAEKEGAYAPRRVVPRSNFRLLDVYLSVESFFYLIGISFVGKQSDVTNQIKIIEVRVQFCMR